MHGYRVVSCNVASSASAAFRKSPFISLLLTDMQMPGQSGLELARELTALSPHLPVLIVSGRTPAIEAQREMHARGWAFLNKTANEPELLSTIASLLNRIQNAGPFDA